MTAHESNGIKKFLIGAAVSVSTTLVLQTGVLIWWCATINSQTATNSKDIEKVETRVDRLEGYHRAKMP